MPSVVLTADTEATLTITCNLIENRKLREFVLETAIIKIQLTRLLLKQTGNNLNQRAQVGMPFHFTDLALFTS